MSEFISRARLAVRPSPVPDREEPTLPALFEAQVARNPSAVAVRFDAESVTYTALNQQANRLAHHLIGLGIGPEDIVAMALPKSIEMIVTLLAISKAGAAYLPLDPSYPVATLAFMIQDARPCCIITRSDRAASFDGAARLIRLDNPAVAAALARAPAHDPTDMDRVRPLRNINAAYVLYTSGSTGLPKGVVVTHVGIPYLAAAQAAHFEIGPSSRVLQFCPISFDGAVWELCYSLLQGATMVIVPPERRIGRALAQLIAEHKVTDVALPPAVLARIPRGGLSTVNNLIVAAESCPGSLVDHWSRGRRMVNSYGPTETTVCASNSDALSGRDAPSIGRPIMGTRIYVLDEQLRPLPVGGTGEIYIAGYGVARGYLGRPALTAERFVADPFGPPGMRMYRSGDLGRWRPDGSLDFLGRADHQIKIEGYRIEPGEIEAVLLRHPTVAQAVVIASEGQGSRYLVAYVVPMIGQRIDPTELKVHVALALPGYMVPAMIQPMDALPLSPNGKVDRRRLPHVALPYVPRRGSPAWMMRHLRSVFGGGKKR